MTKKRIEQAVEYLKDRIKAPELLIILGSGLGDYAETFSDAEKIPYSDIPGFPKSTVPGHAGRLVVGEKHGKIVAVMQGRFHCYEGYSPQEVVIPIRVMIKLGCKIMLATNAAGGVNERFHPGDLMLITDHINLAGFNPLMGENHDDLGPRFSDMSYAYDKQLRQLLIDSASKRNIRLQQGVYCLWSGPSFETPAEIVYSRTIGASAVGMSTVPEVIAANHGGMRCAGISFITNLAAGMLDQPLNHEEVLETG
ncbi:MAG: purine-nucleoside phosphorylase, partial [Eubacteriales bacterium]